MRQLIETAALAPIIHQRIFNWIWILRTATLNRFNELNCQFHFLSEFPINFWCIDSLSWRKFLRRTDLPFVKSSTVEVLLTSFPIICEMFILNFLQWEYTVLYCGDFFQKHCSVIQNEPLNLFFTPESSPEKICRKKSYWNLEEFPEEFEILG